MRLIFSFLLLFMAIVSYAQPANNDCSGVIDLGVAPFCDPTEVYNNIDATPFDTGIDNEPPCFFTNPPQNDVWFQFTTNPDLVNYSITVTGEDTNGNPLENIQFALYRGFCETGSLTLNNCKSVTGNNNSATLNVNNLTPNEIYYIRVDNYGGNSAEGEFWFCIQEKEPDFNIDDGFSDSCEGTLYDSGGPDGNYENNEDFVFTICPQVEHECVELNFEYFNFENTMPFGITGDQMNFYNGPNINSPLIADLSGGQGYGGGAVCYMVRADSCLTIQFISDNETTFEGFKASWTCSSEPCPQNESIEVTEGATYEQIESALSSPFVQVKVDTIICNEAGYGSFTASDNTDLGIKKGILLSTGLATNAEGPNLGINFGDLFGEGDSDLDTLSILYSNGSLSNDACVIEVDVVAYTEELNFEYVFGSEEYVTFVNSQFTDIFALLASGPGITGIPEINNQQNLAIVPSTGEFIEVNTVNHLNNWEYYRNNSYGQSVDFNGLTSDYLGVKKSLTASLVTEPCSTYHLKFAIADRSDWSYESGVFISELSSAAPDITTAFGTGLDYFVEKCLTPNMDSIVISLNEVPEENTTYSIVINGTATAGVDYDLDIPSEITFLAGNTELKFPIVIYDDDLTEGTETVIIELYRDAVCEVVKVAEKEIIINDALKISINGGQDTLNICAGNDFQIIAEGANTYQWTPFTKFDDPFIANPLLIDTENAGWLYVNAVIDPFIVAECTDVDSVFIQPIDPVVNIIAPDDLEICSGESITVVAENNVNDSGLTWEGSDPGVQSPNSAMTEIIPSFFTFPLISQYIVTVDYLGCTASDTINITSEFYESPVPLFSDTTICQGDTLQLIEPYFPVFDQEYKWEPDDLIPDQFGGVPTTIVADINDQYTFSTHSPSNICGDTLVFNLDILPNSGIIVQGDSVRICLGEEIELSVITNPEEALVTWSADQPIINPNDKTIIVSPPVTTTYYVDYMNGICSGKDSIIVYVDSLPSMPIDITPIRDPYCFGEIITFTSPGLELSNFPLIEYEWSPSIGVQNSVKDYNLVVAAIETTDYIRTTTNGACTVMDTVSIRVINPSLEININDTIVCPGDEIELSFEVNEGELEEIEWESSESINDFSCTDCPNPTFTANISSNVTISGEVEGCPTSATIIVDVYEANHELLIPEFTFCGQFIDLNITNSEEITNIVWTTDGSSPFTCTDCPNPSIQVLDEEFNVTVTFDSNNCPYELTATINRLDYGGDASVINPDSQFDENCFDVYYQGDILTLVPNLNYFPPEGTVIQWYKDGKIIEGLTGTEVMVTLGEDLSDLDNDDDCLNVNFSWNFTDIYGCFGEGGVDVSVKKRFAAPNAFSPGNNDDHNDVFRLVDRGTNPIDLTVNQFTVYNRWGQLMFDCDDIECALDSGWNGTYKDVKQPSDTYMFYIEIEYPTGAREFFKGDLLLMK